MSEPKCEHKFEPARSQICIHCGKTPDFVLAESLKDNYRQQLADVIREKEAMRAERDAALSLAAHLFYEGEPFFKEMINENELTWNANPNDDDWPTTPLGGQLKYFLPPGVNSVGVEYLARVRRLAGLPATQGGEGASR